MSTLDLPNKQSTRISGCWFSQINMALSHVVLVLFLIIKLHSSTDDVQRPLPLYWSLLKTEIPSTFVDAMITDFPCKLQ